jgi:hypothetical protein
VQSGTRPANEPGNITRYPIYLQRGQDVMGAVALVDAILEQHLGVL